MSEPIAPLILFDLDGTLLDSAMACAVMTMVPRGSVYTTLEYKINILRSIPLA